jgi:4-coumarate--CoA ligase
VLPPYALNGKSAKKEVAMIGFSSGTTGKMKGVTLSHYNLNATVFQARISAPERTNSSNREVWFPPCRFYLILSSAIPWSFNCSYETDCHVYGMYMVTLINMWVGGFVCGLASFDLDTYCKKMEEYKANEMHIVPPIALAFVNSPNIEKYDLSSIRAINIAAAPLKQSLQSALREKFPGVPITQMYGSTEGTGGVTAQRIDTEETNGSVGKLLSGIDGRVVDPVTKKDVPTGEEGELWVRGPNMMMGYYGNEAATKDAFEGEWQRTGDLVKVDKNGDIWVVDRLKEMIKYKGSQVPPSELEDLLMAHPLVTDAGVTSIYSDAQATELPIAYVALTPEKAALGADEIRHALEDIRSWADGKVSGYKKLRGGVHHLQTLPRNPSGKILRKDLPCNKKNNKSAVAMNSGISSRL